MTLTVALFNRQATNQPHFIIKETETQRGKGNCLEQVSHRELKFQVFHLQVQYFCSIHPIYMELLLIERLQNGEQDTIPIGKGACASRGRSTLRSVQLTADVEC